MTLIVSGDPAFLNSVASAINEICPCDIFFVDVDGKVRRNKGADCKCYCDHRAGCNLIRRFVSTSAKFTIVISQGGGLYNESINKAFWNPSDFGVDLNDDGTTGSFPSMVLAHEQVHALVDLKKLSPPDEEHFVVRGENQVREENDHALRIEYNAEPVPNHTGDVIETDDEHDCDCKDRKARKLIKGTPGEPESSSIHQDPTSDPLETFVARTHPYLVMQYRRAVRARERSAHYDYIHDLMTRFDHAPAAVRLESVGVAGGYRVILIGVEDDQVTLISNLVLNGNPARPYVGELGRLLEYRLSVSQDTTSALDRIARMPFAPGIGGDLHSSDGAVDFLWTNRDAEPRRTALYGNTYEALHGHWERPSDQDDWERWDAITETFALWRRLMLENPDPVAVIAPPASRRRSR